MSSTKDKYYNHKLTLLSSIIVFTFGYTGYHMMYPPAAYLGEEGRVTMHWMIKNACPYLQARLDGITNEDGQIALDPALVIANTCKDHIEQAQFEQVLIREFSRHYD